MPLLYTVIGDLVASRDLADRTGAQRALGEVLDDVSDRLGPAQRLEPTVGDEFQGAFERLSDAVLATLLVRLRMLPVVDVRCGLGYGEVTVHDSSRRPLLQDGPGWWSARDDALDVLEAPRHSAARTWYAGPGAGRVNAFLLTRDALVDRLNERGHRLLYGALVGETQQRLAEQEQISKSAVSQQFARGVGAVRDAQLAFAEEEEV